MVLMACIDPEEKLAKQQGDQGEAIETLGRSHRSVDHRDRGRWRGGGGAGEQRQAPKSSSFDLRDRVGLSSGLFIKGVLRDP